MKWLLFFTAVHGAFSTDQCRVLRQVRLAPAECRGSFAAERSLAANFSRHTPAGAPSPTGASNSPDGLAGSAPGGPSGGKPGTGSAADAGGSPSGPSGPASGGSAPGGSPGNPGGGASDAFNPIQPPPQKPAEPLDPAEINKPPNAEDVVRAARALAIARAIANHNPGKPSRADVVRIVLAARAIQAVRDWPYFGDKPGVGRSQGRNPGMGNP